MLTKLNLYNICLTDSQIFILIYKFTNKLCMFFSFSLSLSIALIRIRKSNMTRFNSSYAMESILRFK